MSEQANIRELARYLAASYVAWQLGYTSIDYVLRTKIPKKLPAHWLAFAKEAHKRMNPGRRAESDALIWQGRQDSNLQPPA